MMTVQPPPPEFYEEFNAKKVRNETFRLGLQMGEEDYIQFYKAIESLLADANLVGLTFNTGEVRVQMGKLVTRLLQYNNFPRFSDCPKPGYRNAFLLWSRRSTTI
jgi:hypothetical protein